MFEYTVMRECTAPLNRSQEGFLKLASARALCLTTFYSCPSISGVFQKFRDFLEGLEVVWEFRSCPELRIVQRDERRGQE